MPSRDVRSQYNIPAISFALPSGAIQLVNPPRPAFVSQKTSLAILGIPPDRFLLMVRAPGFPLRVTSVGKLRMVETEPVIAYLRELGQYHPEIDADEIGVNDNAESTLENDDQAARKLGAALGFTFNDDPPASGTRRKGVTP